MILFCIIVNKQGRIRIRRNYQHIQEKEREQRETAIVKKVLMRDNKQCNFFSHGSITVVYKKYTTLSLICGVTKEENELAIQELLNVFMDCIVSYFHHVSELDIVHNMERIYIILDEIIVNGSIAYTSKERALIPLQLIDASS
ncbi:AP-4 complex subunit sigma-1-like isoform X2 [Physella acuta]|nr:AP-4 complex subunit sigma-1-like isoform X2 [Physella acuta]XP_059161129.1 AP-4 complex subunit sigma-1-like isoform X2 [Physella acuta]XP_059161130.1 AP-4 complex subunit sigma-1-like isoform X2 [Physella acuta]XP_059161131.1 AP-4 complex subunit sigma-1-like isoform X2 [Physella acuta]